MASYAAAQQNSKFSGLRARTTSCRVPLRWRARLVALMSLFAPGPCPARAERCYRDARSWASGRVASAFR